MDKKEKEKIFYQNEEEFEEDVDKEIFDREAVDRFKNKSPEELLEFIQTSIKKEIAKAALLMTQLSAFQEKEGFLEFDFDSFEEFFLEQIGTEKALSIYKKYVKGDPLGKEDFLTFTMEMMIHLVEKYGEKKKEIPEA